MQYFEAIEKMAKEKSKSRVTTQAQFYQTPTMPMYKALEFSFPRAEIESLQTENFELKKKIQDLIAEKTQMVLASTSGTSFHLGKTAITTNNTYFNEASHADLIKSLKKIEAKAEDRKKEIKRLFSLLKDKELEIEELNRTGKANISDTLKGELNYVIKEFEGNLENKYHRLEDELMTKQIQIDKLMKIIQENNIEPPIDAINFNDKNNKALKELDGKISIIQEKLKRNEGLTIQKKMEYEEMLWFLQAEKNDLSKKKSDPLMKSPQNIRKNPENIRKSPINQMRSPEVQAKNSKIPKNHENLMGSPETLFGSPEVSNYASNDKFHKHIKRNDVLIQKEASQPPPISRNELEALRNKLDESNKARDDAIKSKNEALKLKDEAVKAKDDAYRQRDEAIKAKQESIKENAKINEKSKNIEKNYQERIKQINKENDNIQEKYQMVLKDLESQIIEKNKEIEEINSRLGGTLNSQHEKSLIEKELEVLTGKILDDFSSIFKLLSINQQEFQHLDIECCFELLGIKFSFLLKIYDLFIFVLYFKLILLFIIENKNNIFILF